MGVLRARLRRVVRLRACPACSVGVLLVGEECDVQGDEGEAVLPGAEETEQPRGDGPVPVDDQHLGGLA